MEAATRWTDIAGGGVSCRWVPEGAGARRGVSGSAFRPSARATVWSGWRITTRATLLVFVGSSSSGTGGTPAGAGVPSAPGGVSPAALGVLGGAGSDAGGETSSVGSGSGLAAVSTGADPGCVWPAGAESTSSSGTGAGDGSELDCALAAASAAAAGSVCAGTWVCPGGSWPLTASDAAFDCAGSWLWAADGED